MCESTITRTHLRPATAFAAALLLGLGVAACGGSGDTAGDSTATSGASPAASRTMPSRMPAMPPSAGMGSGTMPPSTMPGGPGNCAAAPIAVTAGRREGAAGHQYQVVVFTNSGERACRLRGYPMVAGLDAAGTVVARARHEPGFPLTTVALDPGESASALVSGVSVPTGTGPCAPDYAALSVAPPHRGGATRLAVTLPACGGLWVRPVVAGVTGE